MAAMELGLRGRTALITGASKGIGRAVADRLASEGCDVWLVARSESALAQAAGEITSTHGVAATPIAADLSDSDEVDRVWASTPCVDIVVNNAGAIPSGSIVDVDEDTWREAWDLKVHGYINLTRRALTDMGDRGSGVIVNIIGAGGEKPTPGYIAGAGGNAALMAITRALGSTSRRQGVRVVGINPGLIHTERLESLLRRNAELRLGDADRWSKLLDQRDPPGDVDHIAAAVAFLASDLSGNTTGTIVTIDGGASAR
jgi:NAD(P)-dependent dehydrogenase (short-subunit alcohol dehydrogenase family)